ncbi:MAG: LptF/LptG family permease [Planctomycetota bacterium]|nr:LptF/LptG family permease [Planctomycetota bacterium]
MPFRRPMRLWRSLTADLLRLGVLSSVVLVGVISFAFAVRFLAEGRVDPAGALRLMALAAVPMLQYALPFACGLAATLTYHRVASDNEASAAMAGGISHRSLLAPAGMCAVVLAVALAFMAHEVIPRFLLTIERVVTRDLTGLLVRSIDRGESFRLGNVELHARQVVPAGSDPQVGAFDRLRLRGVLAVTLDERGRARGYISADDVFVWMFEERAGNETFTSAQLYFRGASGEGVGDAIRSGRLASQRIRIPSRFSDDPKFLSFEELRALRERPENIGRVEALRSRLARALDQREVVSRLRGELTGRGSAVFVRPGGEAVTVRGAEVASEGTRLMILPRAGEPVRVDRRTASGTTLRLLAGRAWLEPDEPGGPGEAADPRRATFALHIEGASVEEEGGAGSAGISDATVLGGLTLAGEGAGYAEQSSAELLALARGESEEGIVAAARALRARIEDLQREVTSKQHERAAYAVACALTLLCGAVTALRRDASMPLPVYLWSFLPALGSVITISAGQGLTHKAGAGGLALLWGGVAALGAYVLVEYSRLRRH